jgi:hypothetical protein
VDRVLPEITSAVENSQLAKRIAAEGAQKEAEREANLAKMRADSGSRVAQAEAAHRAKFEAEKKRQMEIFEDYKTFAEPLGLK